MKSAWWAVIAAVALSGCIFQKQKSSSLDPATIGFGGGNQANGSGYGGGDGQLAETRKMIIRSMYEMGNHADLDLLASPKSCEGIDEPNLCNRILPLTTDQQLYIRNFTAAVANSILLLNTGATPTAFKLSADPLLVTLPDGSTRFVAGRTKLGPTGDIELHDSALKSMTSNEKIALIVHEFGHKVTLADNSFLNDVGPQGPFLGNDGGRQFLDAFGAAVALFLAKNLGKASVMYPDVNYVCNANAMATIVRQSAYFLPPGPNDQVEESRVGQSVASLTNAFNATAADPFTLFAIARADADMGHALEFYKGNAIVSNMDSGLPYSGWRKGFILLRMRNGNLGVYVSSGRLLDTKLPFSAGAYHFIAVKRNVGKIFVYLDHKMVALDDLYHDSDYNEDGDLIYNTSPNTSGIDTINSGSSDAPASIAKQGLNFAFCNPRANQGVDYACVDAWKGNVTSVSYFRSPLSDAKILSEFKCVSGNTTVTAFEQINPYATPTASPSVPTPTPTDGPRACPAGNYNGNGTPTLTDEQKATIKDAENDMQYYINGLQTSCETTIPVTYDWTGYFNATKPDNNSDGWGVFRCSESVDAVKSYCEGGPNSKAWVKKNITAIHCAYQPIGVTGDGSKTEANFVKAIRLCDGKMTVYADWIMGNTYYPLHELLRTPAWRSSAASDGQP